VKYGFIPAEQRPVTYITANFLHLSWLHLIGNMWFLWLAGFVLEDHWGRIVYVVFYLLAGAAAQQLYGWMSSGSITPAVGASGAVAGLMGAFLVRFPKMKIEMAWFWFFGLTSYRFKAAAYWLLSAWLLIEVLSGALFGAATGVAHWAHVGGFVFGAIAAYGLSLTRVEQKVNQSLDEKAEWQCDPALAQATEMIEQNQFDQALALLHSFLASHPDSLDAAHLLQQIYWRKGDLAAFYDASLELCALHLKARDWESAWQCYQEARNVREQQIPAKLWFDLCRAAENLKKFDLALQEYRELASTCPADRHCLMAQIAAGRICLSHLQRPREALHFFQEAAASPIPHLDWEQTIEAGIRNAQAAISSSRSATPAVLANK
jgi:membrane associated rhomboid family serine protease